MSKIIVYNITQSYVIKEVINKLVKNQYLQQRCVPYDSNFTALDLAKVTKFEFNDGNINRIYNTIYCNGNLEVLGMTNIEGVECYFDFKVKLNENKTGYIFFSENPYVFFKHSVDNVYNNVQNDIYEQLNIQENDKDIINQKSQQFKQCINNFAQLRNSLWKK